MIRLQGWRSRFAAALLCASVVIRASAEDLQIQSFDGTGKLTYNTLVCATNYRLEWASSATCPWTNFAAAAAALDNMPISAAGSVTCFVPMCYRVVASVTNIWPVINLTGDLALTGMLPPTYASLMPGRFPAITADGLSRSYADQRKGD